MPIARLKTKVKEHPTIIPWFIWGCAVAFYIYQLLLRVSPSVLADDWMAAFQINAAALGVMSAGFYYTYVCMQIPIGILMDKGGPRLLISIASFVCAFGCFLVAKTESFALAVLSRTLMGLGAACGFLGCIKIATLWFPKNRLGLLAGLTTSLGTIGALFGNLPLAFFTHLYSWRLILTILGIVGLSIGFIVWNGVRNGHEKLDPLPTEKHPPVHKVLAKLMKTPQVWIFSLFGFCMYTPVAAFTDLWGVTFFKQTLALSEAQATSLNSFTILGLIAAGPVFAGISEKLQSHKWTMFLSALCLFLTFSGFYFAHQLHHGFLGFLCFMFGVSFGGEVLCFAAVCSLMPRNMGGISTGFTNMIVMMSGTLFQPLVGYLLQKYGTYKLINNVPFYTPESFQIAFLPIISVLFMAVFLSLQMKETYPKLVTK